jgi:molybdopterin-containing oxidoreductase family membrane subunit
LVALIAWGAYGYLQQRLHGDVVTGMRTIGDGGAAWGLYIAFDITFAGLAFAGIAVASIARFFRVRELRPFSRMALLMAVIALMMAGLCVLADLGRPLAGLLNLPRYARTQSPFFGTFTMIIGAGLTASLVQLYLSSRADAALLARRGGLLAPIHRLIAAGWKDGAGERNRHRITSAVLSAFLFPLIVVAYSTLGFVFGIQSGRPGWFSAIQAPSFVVLAGISGIGLLVVVAGIVRARGAGELLPERGFRWLGIALNVLLLVYLYFLAVQELTSRYAATAADTRVAHAITSGPYAPLYAFSVGCLVAAWAVLGLQLMRRRSSIRVAMLAGVLANMGAIPMRVLIVVPSQTHGVLLPYPTGSYAPTWVEVAVVSGLLALGTLLYVGFARVFPLVPLQPMQPEHFDPVPISRPGRRAVRLALFWLVLSGGVAAAAVGFASSARIGNEPYLDPTIPFAPVLFIAGMVAILGSAVVYELIPRSLPPAEP